MHNHLVSPALLAAHLQDDSWQVVDCRFDLKAPEKGYDDYRAGHIPGAVYAHLDKDLAAPIGPDTGRHPLPPEATFAETLGSWGIDNDTQVVAYDNAGGAIAARLWWMLNWLGHSAIAILDGGMDHWQRFGGPIATALPRVSGRRFTATPDSAMVIDSDEIIDKLAGYDDFILFDARDEQRFLGNVEPIDSKAGHVPGALNFPFSTSVNEDGTWRDTQALGDEWATRLKSRADGEWAVMCGSGVTACHLALSASLAGISAPRLYVGSWSEWIRDPDRPVAVGEASGCAD
jgi:thiosulfate/3-mercaptopyruvate sulfurtransferase